jgi:hypothetical protein
MGRSRKAGIYEAQVYREIEHNSDLYKQAASVIDHPQYGRMNVVDRKKLTKLVKAKYPREELERRQRYGYFG